VGPSEGTLVALREAPLTSGGKLTYDEMRDISESVEQCGGEEGDDIRT